MIASKDEAIRSAAHNFAQNLDRSIYTLQREIRSGKFVFEAQRGFLKRPKGRRTKQKKEPRPIVVAPVRSRIVQRAILDLCQSDNRATKRQLGSLPAIIRTETSVGGLPERGVPEAIKLITRAINSGARWFVRSDLKKFFQTIPKDRIEKFLRENISDASFVDLFMRALRTELENEAEVRELIHLFPLHNVGVPQGSALSALCANIILVEFDADLNSRGISTIRYLDDFVILGPARSAVLKAWGRAQKILKSLGMECHDPNAGTGKAAMGEISSGFEFLSFHIDDRDVFPSIKAKSEFISDLKAVLSEARKSISAVKDEPRRAQPRFIQSLDLLDRKIRGWGDAFKCTTKRLVLSQLDLAIDTMIADYFSWFGRFRNSRSAVHQRRLMGIALLRDTKDAVEFAEH